MSGPAAGGGGSGDPFGNLFGNRNDEKIEQNIPGYTIVKLPGKMQMLPGDPNAPMPGIPGGTGGTGSMPGGFGRTIFRYAAGTPQGIQEREMERQRRHAMLYQLNQQGQTNYPMPSQVDPNTGQSVPAQQGPYPGLTAWPAGLPMPPPVHHFLYPKGTDAGTYERAKWNAEEAQRKQRLYEQFPQLQPAAQAVQTPGAPALVPGQAMAPAAASPYAGLPLSGLPAQLPAMAAPPAAAPSVPPTSYNQNPAPPVPAPSAPPAGAPTSTVGAILDTLKNMWEGKRTPAFGGTEPGQATPSAPPVGPQSFNVPKGPDDGSMRYNPLPESDDEEEAA
jgi:hypothetical protein